MHSANALPQSGALSLQNLFCLEAEPSPEFRGKELGVRPEGRVSRWSRGASSLALLARPLCRFFALISHVLQTLGLTIGSEVQGTSWFFAKAQNGHVIIQGVNSCPHPCLTKLLKGTEERHSQESGGILASSGVLGCDGTGTVASPSSPRA